MSQRGRVYLCTKEDANEETFVVQHNDNSWRDELRGERVSPFTIPPEKIKKQKAVIMAAGEGERWGNYLGVPKQLIKIDGEPILNRTIRLLRENGIYDIYVTVPEIDFYGELDGVKQIKGTKETEIDKFLNAKEHAGAIFLWGDVFFTRKAMETICSNKKSVMFFGRVTIGGGIGLGWKEFFALKTNKEIFKKAEELKKHASEMERCASWELYTFFTEGRIPKKKHECSTRAHPEYFTEINDETEDFDYPKHYDTWIRNYDPTTYKSRLEHRLDRKRGKIDLYYKKKCRSCRIT
jgi:hypothetical protein